MYRCMALGVLASTLMACVEADPHSQATLVTPAHADDSGPIDGTIYSFTPPLGESNEPDWNGFGGREGSLVLSKGEKRRSILVTRSTPVMWGRLQVYPVRLHEGMGVNIKPIGTGPEVEIHLRGAPAQILAGVRSMGVLEGTMIKAMTLDSGEVIVQPDHNVEVREQPNGERRFTTVDKEQAWWHLEQAAQAERALSVFYDTNGKPIRILILSETARQRGRR
jgi:hypothetical protein